MKFLIVIAAFLLIAVPAQAQVECIDGECVRVTATSEVLDDGVLVNVHFSGEIYDQVSEDVLDTWNQFQGDDTAALIRDDVLTIDEAQALWAARYLRRYQAETTASDHPVTQDRSPAPSALPAVRSKINGLVQALENIPEDDRSAVESGRLTALQAILEGAQ